MIIVSTTRHGKSRLPSCPSATPSSTLDARSSANHNGPTVYPSVQERGHPTRRYPASSTAHKRDNTRQIVLVHILSSFVTSGAVYLRAGRSVLQEASRRRNPWKCAGPGCWPKGIYCPTTTRALPYAPSKTPWLRGLHELQGTTKTPPRSNQGTSTSEDRGHQDEHSTR